MRSKTFGYTVLMKMQQAAELLSKEHDPKKITSLKQKVDRFYDVWERTAERRKTKRYTRA
jgi:hypothetical protein